MKNIVYGITFILSLCICPTWAKSTTHHNPSLMNEITHIIDGAKDVDVGVLISQVKTGKVLYSRRANFLFKPASAQKLFTAIAALYYLGSEYQFHTQLLTGGEIHNHTLNGDLTVKFSGDPELTTDDLNALIGKLKDLGVHRIKGHVYIDNMDYGPVPYPPGWMWDDLSYGYAAPLNAIIINRNKFLLHLMPATKKNQPPKLYPILPAGVTQFSNRAKTILHHDKECPLTIYSDAHNHYTVSGCINRGWGRQRRTLAIRNPLLYAKVLIQQSLQDNNIDYQKPITARKANDNTIVLAQHSSPSLREMLKEMLKTSDNLTTDSLLKKMGQQYYKQQGTWQNGLHALKKILKPSGINFKHNLINDGAGLSQYNLVTPHQFAQLLHFAYQHTVIRVPLLGALPIGAKDGTLIYRMHPTSVGKHVHAKTGSMAGISALAGYINSRHHGVLSFVIMVNGFVGKDRPYHHLEDKICKLLVHR